MGLQVKLDAQRKEFEASVPPEVLTILHRATDDLLQSGIMEQALKVGKQAPGFILSGEDGASVNASDLLGRGPLVVTFYRGVW